MTTFRPHAPLRTPVLFLVFNRPEPTARVFEAIRRARPPRLYIGADGPRTDRDGESERVAEVRRLVTAVDWPCEVKTLFRDHNLGCRDAVSGAITWFFENEEQGIILEDDCLPSQSFFWFCDKMLEHYKDDMRIWQIAGFNALPSSFAPFEASYYFTAYGSIWGWATWRNRWEHFDANLSQAEAAGIIDFVLAALGSDEYPQRRRRQMDRIVRGQVSIWDYQWFFARLANSGLSVVPAVNLVSNIGFGDDATHTSLARTAPQPRAGEVAFPLIYPPYVVRDRRRDVELLDMTFKTRGVSRQKRAILKLTRCIGNVGRDA